ncbi:MAG: hypothetical protein L6Q92_10930 [Phycisphaerae bacterium]|nr:hypothetical protein [Phycisphaerae bacterium]
MTRWTTLTNSLAADAGVEVVLRPIGSYAPVACAPDAARQESLRIECLSNLTVLGRHGGNHQLQDPRGIMCPQSRSGLTNWIGLGGRDFGWAITPISVPG